jgi:hypothetical protein
LRGIARCYAYLGVASSQLKNFALSPDADFGRLTNSSFFSLRDAYSGWSKSRPAVIWDPNRNYTLLDFLPPVMQARAVASAARF